MAQDDDPVQRLAYFMGGLTGTLASTGMQQKMVHAGVELADIAALNKLLLKIATTLFYDQEKPQ